MASPRDYGLRHSKFRPHQFESIQWALDVKEENGVAIPKVTEQPTGSGKSPIAVAISSQYQSTLVLTATRNLQNQYRNESRTVACLYGKANYKCVHPNASPKTTVDQCLHYKAPGKCHMYAACPYYTARASAKKSSIAVFNYALWLTTGDQWNPEYLIMDEAHNLSNVVLNFVGTTITDKTCKFWGLPDIPTIEAPINGVIIKRNTVEEARGVALEWLNKCAGILSEAAEYNAPSELSIEADTLYHKIVSTVYAVELKSDISHWYIRGGAGYRPEPVFMCRPLTARHDFKRLFLLGGWPSLSMSATMGDMNTYAKELGIEKYEGRVVPNLWPPNTRPIRVLPVPSMGHSSVSKDPGLFDVQADAIAKAILDHPREWAGLILVTRKLEAKLLADRLSRRGLQDRMYILPGYDGEYTPTEKQVAMLNERMNKVPNTICTSWSLWEGFDGTRQKICIVAKIPFPYMVDDYERERMEYDGSMFLQRTAWQLEQGLGRTRRGEKEDYDGDGIVRGLVAIADGSWVRVKKYLSESTREAIVNY